jgi:glycosyltransferase involved in cell wall biosynthesis
MASISSVTGSQRKTIPLGSSERFPISVMILTLNESANIEDCLAYLDWADDVIMVDSYSTDDTIERALRVRPDLRVFEHAFRDFGDQRNWALDNTAPRNEWILFLDADERCNEACAASIRSAIRGAHDTVGFHLACRNMFLGRWIRHCTLYPSWQLRLLKAGRVRYRKEGHGQREVTQGEVGYIDQPYDHFGFQKGIADWIERHNHYSTQEIELIMRLRQERLQLGDLLARDPIVRRRCLKRLAARIGFRPWLRFFYIYFVRGGVLDGRAGLQFSLLRLAHEIHIEAKLAEAALSRTDDASLSEMVRKLPKKG